MEWGKPVRAHLTRIATALTAESRQNRREIPFTEQWLTRPHQGRALLGEAMTRLPLGEQKRRLLQAIAGTFPCQALLYKWRLSADPACPLCRAPTETFAHIQCWCPALQERRIQAHHSLVQALCAAVPAPWQVYRELTVADLMSVQAPVDGYDQWQRMCDELQDEDLEGSEEEAEAAASLRRKRPDAFLISWGRRRLVILEFTRAYDRESDWALTTDDRKRQRYLPLQTKLADNLPGWQVETVALSVGVRGSIDELIWQDSLTRIGISRDGLTPVLRTLVELALTECNEVLKARSAARINLAAAAGQSVNAT